jgi:hypothetical protein
MKSARLTVLTDSSEVSHKKQGVFR